jgi:hypothetical protein
MLAANGWKWTTHSLECTWADKEESTKYVDKFELCTAAFHGNYFIFSLCFHMVFNNSLLFMSMSNLILINLHFMDMEKHVLMFFFIYMLVDKEKE